MTRSTRWSLKCNNRSKLTFTDSHSKFMEWLFCVTTCRMAATDNHLTLLLVGIHFNAGFILFIKTIR